MNDKETQFLTRTEAAELLRVSPRTLDRLTKDGVGPPVTKVGARVLYKREELDRWATGQQDRPTCGE